MELIVSPRNLQAAWRQAKGNRGAPGPDGMTTDDFEDWAHENWTTVRQQLMDGTYQPQPVRRKTIPKPGGKGDRLLGIPNVLDRLIQQAIVQVLTPIFDPSFSESSFGFRPKRSAHQAVKQVQKIIRQGKVYCIDIDLSKFFDRVQHDVLMNRVSRKVHDKRLLRLIGRYLRAGVMIEGVWIRRRLRICYWKQWRYPRTKVKQLTTLGIRLDTAIKHAISRKKYWRMSRTPALRNAMTNQWLKQQGWLSLKQLWYERASLRGTA